jgi:Ca2+-binding RTX toxin-like protein
MAIDLVNVAAGSGGFVIHGQDAGDQSGWSVASAGDINGDGFDDLIIGATYGGGPGNTRLHAGDSYVVFGKASGFAAEIDLATVAAGAGGFVIHGQDAGDLSGWSVASAGDINGDGFDDLIIGAPFGDGPGNARSAAGDSYVVFGKASGFAAEIDLANVAAGTGGFVIHGQDADDQSGYSVASAGDINGDGFADLIIGANHGDGPGNTRNDVGDSYVLFGKASGFAAEIDLATVAAGTGGFVIHGQDLADLSGWSVASAGDLNGDGFDDLIIGAFGGDGPGNTRMFAGDSYVVFGKASGFAAEINLATVAAGTGGFVIHGQDAGDGSGFSVASAGDVNRDGFDDLIIGAYGGDGPSNARNYAGDSYVVFGKASGFAAEIDLATVAAGTGGFVIHGQDAGDESGRSVASAGDVNGDGFDDLIIGARYGDGPGNTRLRAGDSYVVFGKASGFANEIDLAAVAGGNGGFVINGQDATDESAHSVASAGDIDGDGFDDLIIGADGGDGPSNTRGTAGDSYVLFGSATIGGSVNHVTHLGGNGNDTLTGDAAANDMVGGRGNDTLIGSGGADVLIGGQGNDTLVVSDNTFARVDGGNGSDTLELAGAFTMTDTDFRRVDRVESITLSNFATTLTLGPIAEHAFDSGGSIFVFNNLLTNAPVTIDGSAVVRPLLVNVANDASNVVLTGGSADDAFLGGNGNDVFEGGKGADTMKGGGGSDTLSYASSALGVTVSLFEGTASGGDATGDTFDSIENLTGSNQNDFLTGDNNNNILVGGGGDDLLQGAGGDDVLEGGPGGDTFDGGAGNDTVTYAKSPAAVTVNLGFGLGAGGDAQLDIFVTNSVENLVGSAQGDQLTGDVNSNILNGGPGADTLTGGDGNDSYFVDNAGDLVTENANEGTDTVLASINYTLPANVENLLLTGSADVQGFGNGLANTLTGNGGSNLLDGGSSADTMAGGAGNDVYFVDNSGDAVFENVNQGNDTVFASVSYTLSSEVENLVLQGSADLQGYGNVSNNVVYGNSGNNLLNGEAGIDLMVGSAGNDTYFVDDTSDSCFEAPGQGDDTVMATCNYGIAADVENLILQGTGDFQAYGNNQANVIYGNSGNNLLNGAGGSDLMVGGAGNDVYYVDDPSDSCFEIANEGSDATFAFCNYGLAAEVETLVMQGGADLQGYGNNQANTLYGNSGNNLLNGAGGVDTMVGGAANDSYFVDDVADVVFENVNEGTDSVLASVSYTLSANVEALVLQGSANLNGTGNALPNSLFGNAGDNILDGGMGADVLQGGQGNDTFVFNMGQANGDTVVDFAGQGTATGDSLHFVGYGAGATFTNIDTTHWQVNYNGGAAHEIITFMNGAAIDPSDVLFS